MAVLMNGTTVRGPMAVRKRACDPRRCREEQLQKRKFLEDRP
ncbi:MAG TPA: hypothetical protein PLN56_08500 [Methanoregulaceae archaeon]|nr:hypothetical protein [Methanoregulaceae archaeon]HPD11023.1 hypothetical protein [Methanoregulaceae archaeon]HRT16109.1 hypothetical protein [Methanoregulaceae archaeon]HRU31648.1 hypothetical protein [Methanoregulaceae archaeon]